jgi:hypothetical protein
MRKLIWVAGIAAAAFIPSIAAAQTTCEQQHDRRVAGTVIGGVAGALLGNAVTHGGGRVGGTIIGGVAGAAIGNQVAKGDGDGDCAHAYGYYDHDGRWHANAVAANDAQGYWDRDGQWVQGQPAGYYGDDGRWVSAQSASGYYDQGGRWVPSAVTGYYDQNGQWMSGAAPGYYASNGQWVAGATVGHYDRDGRWMQGDAGGHRDASGNWIADPQPGYWADGQWRQGQVQGYYDSSGRWIPADGRDVGPSRAYANGGGDAPMHDDRWARAGTGLREREAWLGQRIQQAEDAGKIDDQQAHRALRRLQDIRRDDAAQRGADGHLPEDGRMALQVRLDDLASTLRLERDGG